MNKVKRNKILIAAFVLALVPALSFAQTAIVYPQNSATSSTPGPVAIGVPQGFSGIFSCNQDGSYAMSVGALGATGGVYVPVADASVELNTGTLVYKECVLREVVDAQRLAATAGFSQQATNNIQTGRNGASLAAAQPIQEKVQYLNTIIQNDLQAGGALSMVNPAFQTPVANAVARGYVMASQQPSAQLTCTIPDNLTTVLNGQTTNTLGDLAALGNPACNAYGATLIANGLVMNDLGAGSNLIDQELLWGGGYYPVTSGGNNPLLQTIVTPSSNVASSYATILNSPYNQLQNANDIGQMVGALFAGISTQVLSGTGGGITGINQSVGGQPSYLQQAVSQETENLNSTLQNTALVNLDAALQVEQSYYNIMSSIAGTLESTITQLRSSENQCWQQVVQAVCAGPVAANGTCTQVVQCTTSTDGNGDTTNNCPTGQTLKVATSTEFSQPVINSQISALASTTANNLQVSQQALDLINQLIQNVSGTSADSQALAIEQLNTLVANNELHTPADLTTAQTQEQSVQNAMTTLTQNTPSLWAGTDPNNTSNDNIPWNGSAGATIQVTDPGVGWCNFKNQTTIQAWENIWKT
jgi:hypothetical protein